MPFKNPAEAAARSKKYNLETWYPRNRSKHIAATKINSLKYKLAAQEFVTCYLRLHPCIDCGEADLRVLDFDHVRGQKDWSVSKLIGNNATLDKLKYEIAKCDIRCANCHRKKTCTERNWFRGKAGDIAQPDSAPVS